MNPLRSIDNWLNSITMYRLLVYGLGLLALLCILLSASHVLTVPLIGMLISLVVVVVGCYLTNHWLANIWHVSSNQESWLITALILFFIMPQSTTVSRAGYLLIAAILAIASKYILAFRAAHIFNPAAFGAAIVGVAGFLSASWWIGSSQLWPVTLLLGVLIVRKIRRFSLVSVFMVVSLLLSFVTAMSGHTDIGQAMRQAATASPLIFLGTIMLTEPSTMPGRRGPQLLFAGLVATLYTLHWQVAGIYIAPELALVLGNVYVFIDRPKSRVRLTLQTINKVSARVYDYVFTTDRPLPHQAGQYMEWTLPGVRQNERGNRRTFTIASAPHEHEVHLGVKFYEPSSSYKKVLQNLQPGDYVYAGQIAGNFVLPKDLKQKLVFIAGGIGITPFRSLVKSIIDTKQQRDAVLLYLVSEPDEVMYKDIFEQAEHHGIKLIELPGGRDALNLKILQKHIPDCQQRRGYISGPPAMVRATTALLHKAGVKRSNIETDSFTGY
jgi:ferredoxin-NADP reductase